MEPRPQNFSLLNWEFIEHMAHSNQSEYFANIIRRAKVPGGWLLHTYRELSRCAEAAPMKTGESGSIALGVGEGTGIAFVPDPQHAWKLNNRERALSAAAPKASPKNKESKSTLSSSSA